MAGSNAMDRRRKATARKEAGVELDVSGKEKKAAKPTANCAVCLQTFNITKKNVEMKSHWEAKHPAKKFDECFAGQSYQ